MKHLINKRIVIVGIVLFVACGILFSQNIKDQKVNDEATISYSSLTTTDRVQMLQNLHSEQLSKGNVAAASYLQGRIDFLTK